MQKRSNRLALRVLSTATFLAMVSSCATAAFAGTYYMEDGSISIVAKTDGNYITQGTTINDQKDAGETVITNHDSETASKNTVTIKAEEDCTANVTLDNVNIDASDTGKAAMEGFADVPQTKILVFYPRDGVSEIQKLQMVTQEGRNVGVCAVRGNFDDAQAGVKRIFSDAQLRETLASRGYFLSSANSINWGRVLPQIVYYVSSYCDLLASGAIEEGQTVNVCVPTGNFGNILSGFYAKKMGVPIGRLICASNENNVLTDFIRTGTYDRNRPFYQTASPSMDILISSNLERLLYLLSGSDEEVRGYMQALAETGRYTVSERVFRAVQAEFSCGFCTDAQGAQTIGKTFREKNYLLDTHTAVACTVLEGYRAETGDGTLTVVESTASPFKFCASVLDALGVTEHQPGTKVLGQLTAVTGREAPLPLASLAGKTPRFGEVADKTAMQSVVTEFLQ